MKKSARIAALTICLTTVSIPLVPAADEPPEPMLLGKIAIDRLNADGFADWYVPGRDEYQPHVGSIEALRALGSDGIQLAIFFGTWCGDSRREVPRLAKIFEAAGLDSAELSWIAVDRSAEAYKRSPGGEERGMEIYRVPTVVVLRDGEEIGRIVEYPVLSMERDLLTILRGEDYLANYRSYPDVRRWLADGWLSDPNVDPAGLAGLVRGKIESEGELAAAARTLLTRGQVPEAVKLYRANCDLHRESAGCRARLALALLEQGERAAAETAVKRALALNSDPEDLTELLEILDRTQADPP